LIESLLEIDFSSEKQFYAVGHDGAHTMEPNFCGVLWGAVGQVNHSPAYCAKEEVSSLFPHPSIDNLSLFVGFVYDFY
jgi:hypothetical protein